MQLYTLCRQGPMWMYIVSEVSCVHVTKFLEGKMCIPHFFLYLFILNVCVFFGAEMLAVM